MTGIKIVSHNHGSHGPRHDPYAYDSYGMELPNGKHGVFVVSGLGTWWQSNSSREQIMLPDSETDKCPKHFPKWDEPIADLGVSTKDLWAALREQIPEYMSACPHCGYEGEVDEEEGYVEPWCGSEPGFPGESFDRCLNCGKIIDTVFCPQAIE